MKTRYEVEVTQMDIDLGVRNNERWCMVTNGIRRLIPEADRVTANQQTIRFSILEGGIRYRFVYLTPRAPREYLILYDDGAEIKPFSFVMEKPQVTETPQRKPGAALNTSVKARAKNASGRRISVRVFGERAYLVNQAKAS